MGPWVSGTAPFHCSFVPLFNKYNSSSRVYLARNNSHSIIIFRVRTMRVNSDATLHIYDLPAINQQLLMGCAHFIVVLFFILL